MTPTEAIAEIRKLKTDDEITEYSRSLPKELRYSYEVQSQLRLRAMQMFHETYQADPTHSIRLSVGTNRPQKNNTAMRDFKENEWRDEVAHIKEQEINSPECLQALNNSINLNRATTRGAILYFYFSLPEDYQADRSCVLDVRRRLRAIRKERRKRVITKIRQWRKSITTRIYRWQLQCEYKRITKQRPNQTSTIEQ